MFKHALLCCAILGCVAYAADRKQPKTEVPAALRSDRRLEKPLSINTGAVPLAQVVPEIHRQLGVDVMVQAVLEGRPTPNLLAPTAT